MPAGFIRRLEDSGAQAHCFLINLHDTWQTALLPASTVVGFLQRCADTAAVRPDASALAIAKAVCLGADDGPHLLRQAAAAQHDGQTWLTLLAYSDCYLYHLDRDALAARGINVPEFPPDVADEAGFAQQLAEVFDQPHWWQTGDVAAHLGPPPAFGGHFWASTTDHDQGFDIAPRAVAGNAHQRASAAGISPGAGAWLLQYRFAAVSTRAAPDAQVARPTFADQGNRWFRVRHGSHYAAHCEARQWGLAAELDAATGSTDGRPERVCQRLPLAALQGLAVQSLGPVDWPDNWAEPSADAFAQTLLDGRELRAIVANLTDLCFGPEGHIGI